jgi:hypothetical protein
MKDVCLVAVEDLTNSVAFSPQAKLRRPSDSRLSAKLVQTFAG